VISENKITFKASFLKGISERKVLRVTMRKVSTHKRRANMAQDSGVDSKVCLLCIAAAARAPPTNSAV